MNQLEQLKQYTIVVADTGEIQEIQKYQPTDATTNPSLLYKAAQREEYQHLVNDAICFGNNNAQSESDKLELTLDKLAVNFGKEILDIIPGRISTEVDSRLSFDTAATIDKAREIIEMYKDVGIDRDRILIKIASTWEGIEAAKVLEKEDIKCNMTLLFSFAQAVACAQANVTLISPFVGRILDWYKKSTGIEHFEPHKDPGVESVTRIYNYYKKNGFKTQVMGASFRNTDEIIELVGCDLLTISPNLLEELKNKAELVHHKLNKETAARNGEPIIEIDEKIFRWMHNEDAMGTEKLAEGIRNFTKDTLQLENYIKNKIVNC